MCSCGWSGRNRGKAKVTLARIARPGSGLDAVRGIELRMSGRVGAEFAEAPDLLDRERPVAGQVEQRIEQRRAVAVRCTKRSRIFIPTYLVPLHSGSDVIAHPPLGQGSVCLDNGLAGEGCADGGECCQTV